MTKYFLALLLTVTCTATTVQVSTHLDSSVAILQFFDNSTGAYIGSNSGGDSNFYYDDASGVGITIQVTQRGGGYQFPVQLSSPGYAFVNISEDKEHHWGFYYNVETATQHTAGHFVMGPDDDWYTPYQTHIIALLIVLITLFTINLALRKP